MTIFTIISDRRRGLGKSPSKKDFTTKTNAIFSDFKNELTAKVKGMKLRPEPMFRQNVNDYFDHAQPATEILARVFREEMKLRNLQNAGQTAGSRQSADEVISLWQAARRAMDTQTIAFIQREGKFGMFYQTFKDINQRNANGKWMMSATIDGKPLPEREVTREDATVFKQGQHTMSDIVLKYYADDLSQPRQYAARNGMGR